MMKRKAPQDTPENAARFQAQGVEPWVEDGQLTLFTEGRITWGTPLGVHREDDSTGCSS